MKFDNASSFQMSLGERLKNLAAKNPMMTVERSRKSVAIERFLARLQSTSAGSWILKGGVALDYRLPERARSTLDVDLETEISETTVVRLVLNAADLDMGDFFSYKARRVPLTLLDNDATTLRFRLEAQLGGRRFETVTLDIGLRDTVNDLTDLIASRNLLEFAGISPVIMPTVPLSQHLAEKLHAYSRLYARDRPSTRIKDLVDIVLVVTEFAIESADLHGQVRHTFSVRGERSFLKSLQRPPDDWVTGYRQIASTVALEPALAAGHRIAAAFFDPVLTGEVGDGAEWSPEQMRWDDRSTPFS